MVAVPSTPPRGRMILITRNGWMAMCDAWGVADAGPYWRPWSQAMTEALLGGGSSDGFYSVAGAARAHFSTPVTAGEPFSRLVARWLDQVDRALSRPPQLDLVDVGGGDGTLVRAVTGLVTDSLARRLRPVLVDVHPGGTELPEEIEGLVVAVEWLDTLPVDVAVAGDDGAPLLVEVAPDGSERARRPLPRDDREWLQDWWPQSPEGGRAESGLRRDRAWQDLVARVTAGAALAVDYGHLKRERPDAGSLTGWYRGRATAAALDGSTDVTAHVAMDSIAAAGERSGMTTLLSSTLRQVLASEETAPGVPDPRLAQRDPPSYLAELSRAGEWAVLADRRGLGAHRVLIQGRFPAASPGWLGRVTPVRFRPHA